MSGERVEFGRMIDCDLNGCSEGHSDNGYVSPWPAQFGQPNWHPTLNHHAVRWVKRTITTSDWEDA